MNWVGTRTLMLREVSRFLGAPVQTIAQPLVTTSVFFFVFAGGIDRPTVAGVSYARFIVPGLVFYAVANTSFINTSTSVFFAKSYRTVEDLLIAPLGPGELLAAFVVGGIVRGLIVGVLTWSVPLLFEPVIPMHLAETLFFCLLTTYLFSMLGVVAGVWAQRFEQVNLFPSFLIMPLTFMGGVFYRVEALPEPARTLSTFNPIVHLVRGMRHGMIDFGDGEGTVAIVVWCAVAAAATAAMYWMLRRGWRLKS